MAHGSWFIVHGKYKVQTPNNFQPLNLSLLHPLLHLLYQLISGRAVFDVLFVHVHIVHHLALGQMRKAGTIGRTDLVDAAFIICQVEELAGLYFIHDIPRAVFAQPFFGKGFRGHFKMPGDAFDVGLRKRRTHRLAAIGAGQTINLLPYFRLQFASKRIQSLGRILFNFGQK